MDANQVPLLSSMLTAMLARETDEIVKSHAVTILKFIGETSTPWRSEVVAGDASRPHSRGHVTASAWVLNHAQTDAALLHHKKLNLWLQPGGHVEESDVSWLEAARREVGEETGLQHLDLTERWGTALFDVDVHDIPARPAKPDREAESAHQHFDLRFIFVAQEEPRLRVNVDESEGLAWFALEKISTDTALDRSVLRMASRTPSQRFRQERNA
jgi:8-oxo-dGTP pyrophosphatase MutT (NUDIX family)